MSWLSSLINNIFSGGGNQGAGAMYTSGGIGGAYGSWTPSNMPPAFSPYFNPQIQQQPTQQQLPSNMRPLAKRPTASNLPPQGLNAMFMGSGAPFYGQQDNRQAANSLNSLLSSYMNKTQGNLKNQRMPMGLQNTGRTPRGFGNVNRMSRY